MSDIQDFVPVNISRETAKITRVGFGTLLILGNHYRLPGRVGTYADPSELLTDGFLVTDDIYKAALKATSQELSPPSFKVGRKLEDVNSKATLAFTGTPSAGTWTLDVGIGNATPVTTGNITYAADDDTALIETAIEALTGITEVTVTGAYSTGYTIEFTGVDAAADFRVTAIDVSSLTGVTAATVTMTQYGSAVETWDTCLNAVIAADDDWYFLVATTRTKADILLLAAIIETKIKMYFLTTADADVKNGVADNVKLSLETLTYDRTVYKYSADTLNFPEAGWIGGQAPKDPGSITWKFKNIVGIVPDVLTPTEFNNIVPSGNTYETVGGVNIISSEATVASGEYIDIIRGTDWLQTRIAEGIFTALVNNDKIPFTANGIGLVEGIIKYWLNEGESLDRGLLAPNESIVTTPNIEDIDPAEKALRYLSGITFSGKYAGALHKIGITGKLTV